MNKLKQLRADIRRRFVDDKASVIKEFLKVQESGCRATKRLYFTALDKLLFDEANKDETTSPRS